MQAVLGAGGPLRFVPSHFLPDAEKFRTGPLVLVRYHLRMRIGASERNAAFYGGTETRGGTQHAITGRGRGPSPNQHHQAPSAPAAGHAGTAPLRASAFCDPSPIIDEDSFVQRVGHGNQQLQLWREAMVGKRGAHSSNRTMKPKRGTTRAYTLD